MIGNCQEALHFDFENAMACFGGESIRVDISESITEVKIIVTEDKLELQMKYGDLKVEKSLAIRKSARNVYCSIRSGFYNNVFSFHVGMLNQFFPSCVCSL
ncbi:unnamed protein product [Amaranthus hypochondriacus]